MLLSRDWCASLELVKERPRRLGVLVGVTISDPRWCSDFVSSGGGCRCPSLVLVNDRDRRERRFESSDSNEQSARMDAVVILEDEELRTG